MPYLLIDTDVSNGAQTHFSLLGWDIGLPYVSSLKFVIPLFSLNNEIEFTVVEWVTNWHGLLETLSCM